MKELIEPSLRALFLNNKWNGALLIKNINRLACRIPVIGIIYILLYRNPALKSICKGISLYLCDWFGYLNLNLIKSLYFSGEYLIRILILVSISILVIIRIYQLYEDNKIKRLKGESRLEESLFRYLHDDSHRSFLVTGSWGSGKTFEVNHFFEKYYSNSTKKIFRVSCFGLSTRNDLTREISNVIEQQDHSLSKAIVDIIIYFPILGEMLNRLLKKSYNYTTVKRGSIFIFDDFERISSNFMNPKDKKVLYTRKPFLFHHGYPKELSSGLENDLISEFKNIEEAFDIIQNEANTVETSYQMDKYIAVVGVINELVETYGMHVLIICNTSVISKKFIENVLISKLNCIEYKKNITKEAQIAVVENVFNNKVFADKSKEDHINSIKDQIKKWAMELDDNGIFKDLRLEIVFLQAFLDTVELFDEKFLSLNFIVSLFNSILITHVAYYSGLINELSSFRNGSYIPFCLKLSGIGYDKSSYLRLSDDFNELRWIRIEISGYWILNLSEPDTKLIIDVRNNWREYQYSGLEEKICRNPSLLQKETSYELRHVLFCRKYDLKSSSIFSDKHIIGKALSLYDLSKTEDVQSILDLTAFSFSNEIYQDFLENLFSFLPVSENEKINVSSDIHREFQHYCNKCRVSD